MANTEIIEKKTRAGKRYAFSCRFCGKTDHEFESVTEREAKIALALHWARCEKKNATR